MRKFCLCLFLLLLIGAFAVEVHATVNSLVGDKDGFGLSGAPAVPADGTLWVDNLSGIFFTDYRDAGEKASNLFTDWWNAPGGFSFTHTYNLSGLTPTSAELDIQIAGIHDINETEVYDLLVDGVIVGQIAPNSNSKAYEEVLLYSFDIPLALLDGSNVISLSGTGGDGYDINFSELKIETEASAVPEPATMLLLGIGLTGLAAFKRKIK